MCDRLTTYQVLGAAERGDADLVVGALADHVELALELRLVGRLRAAGDEHLADERFAGLGRLAEHGVVRRHGARAEVDLPLGLHHAREDLLDLATLRRVARHEDEAGGVLAGLGELDARLLRDVLEEGMRHLHEHAGAVAGVDLAAAGAAVVEVLEHLDRGAQDLVRLAALDVHDEADAAGVALVARVVETLLLRRSQAGSGLAGRLDLLLAHRSGAPLDEPMRGAQTPRAAGPRPATSCFSIS
ncbi:MAG: hypothetical protein U1F11_00315 [Steroidobacteraceae bacterium]